MFSISNIERVHANINIPSHSLINGVTDENVRMGGAR